MNYEEMIKMYDDEVKELIGKFDEETLKKRFFKDFGCINFISEEQNYELNLARAYHRYHKGLYPNLHKMTETEPFRCYHKESCTCGFSEACDSSD